MAEPAQLRKFLINARLGLGFMAFVMPRTLAKLFGINPLDNPAVPLVTRLFGIREVLMAYQMYQASDDEIEEILRQGIMVDVADTAAALLAMLHGEITPRTFVLAAATSGGVMAAGIAAREPSPTR